MTFDLRNFDIRSYLRMRGITIHTEGKNVSPGWIGVKCPWCSDRSNHLGINIHSKAIKCWKCKKKGSALNLVQKLENCSWDETEKIAENFFEYYVPEEKEHWKSSISPSEVIPKEALEEPLPIHLEYLEKRNFNPAEIIRRYGIKFVHNRGRYKFRILAPIVVDRQTVGFTARDVTGRAELRYISSDRDKYLINPDSILYNIDTVFDTVFVVEGVFDVWRLGDGAVATLGTEFNNYHVNALLVKGVQRAFIIYDPEPEAVVLAEKMAAMLSVSIPQVEIIILDNGDPADLSPAEALNLKQELLTA